MRRTSVTEDQLLPLNGELNLGSVSWYEEYHGIENPVVFMAGMLAMSLGHWCAPSTETLKGLGSVEALQAAFKFEAARMRGQKFFDPADAGIDQWDEVIGEKLEASRHGWLKAREAVVALTHSTMSRRLHVEATDDQLSLVFEAGPESEDAAPRRAAAVTYKVKWPRSGLVEEKFLFVDYDLDWSLIEGREDRLKIFLDLVEKVYQESGLHVLSRQRVDITHPHQRLRVLLAERQVRFAQERLTRLVSGS